MNPKETKPQDGIIGPSPEEVEHFNTLHGSIPPLSRFAKGVAAVLGLGTAVLATEACARPTPPAEVRPIQSPAPTVPAKPKEIPTPTETPKPAEKAWQRFRSTINPYELDYPAEWKTKIGNSRATDADGKDIYQDEFYREDINGIGTAAGILTYPLEMISQVLRKDEIPLDNYKDYLSSILSSVSKNMTLKKLKISSEDAWLLEAKEITTNEDYNKKTDFSAAIFIYGGKLWQIVFRTHYTAEREHEKFQRMLQSFKLLPAETPKPVERPIELGWRRYAADLFEIDVPQQWEQNNQLSGEDYYYWFGSDERIPTARGYYTPAIEIKIGNKINNIPQEFLDISFDEFETKVKQALQSEIERGSVNSLSLKRLIIDDRQALDIAYYSSPSNLSPNEYQRGLYFIRERKAWGIVFKSDPSGRERMEPKFNKILSSFRFLESAKTQQSTPEKSVEQGWTKFRSMNYPYEINYPAGWTAGQKVEIQGLQQVKMDVFAGEVVGKFRTNINIVAEPVNSWVKLEDYKDQKKSPVQITLEEAKAKIAGQDAWIINARIPKWTIWYATQDYDTLTAVFLARGQGWQITLSTDPSVTQTEQTRFRQMLSSFKLIQ